MVLDAVLERFAKKSPVTVMARLALQRALEPQWVDELFEQHREGQYTRELLFSTTVELMALVVVGQRPSVHAAAKAAENLPVSMTALYDKINHTEPALVRALVAGSASRLAPVVAPMVQGQPVLVPGYRLRILDGNHLAASEKRLKVLRGFRGAALPGQSLVVYDPDMDMVVDMIACEDGHTQERALMEPIVQSALPGQIWIADRNFCTRAILLRLHDRNSAFIVREHARNPNPVELDQAREAGCTDTGVVYEQAVGIEDEAAGPVVLRRIEVRLNSPTEDGDTVIRILTNLPVDEFPAERIAQLYRRRWKIEALFQRLESVFNSEIGSLGHPRAALLAFGIAALAYNVLAVLSTAVRVQHQLDATKIELSSYFFAIQIKACYEGMMIAIALDVWQPFDCLTPLQLSQTLLNIAAYANPHALRKHPRAPKPPAKKGYVAGCVARRHVSTARVLKDGGVKS